MPLAIAASPQPFMEELFAALNLRSIILPLGRFHCEYRFEIVLIPSEDHKKLPAPQYLRISNILLFYGEYVLVVWDPKRQANPSLIDVDFPGSPGEDLGEIQHCATPRTEGTTVADWRKANKCRIRLDRLGAES